MCLWGRKGRYSQVSAFFLFPSFLLFPIPSLKEEPHILFQTPRIFGTHGHLDDPATKTETPRLHFLASVSRCLLYFDVSLYGVPDLKPVLNTMCLCWWET